MKSFDSLVELLRHRAETSPNKVAFTFLLDGDASEVCWTYADLDRRAKQVARQLTLSGTKVGDRAVLLYPSGLEFISAFFGCLYAGVIAVPTYPPKSLRDAPRLQALLQDSTPRLVLSDSLFREHLGVFNLGIDVLATDDIEVEANLPAELPAISPDDIAFLQYTSGSTGQPKGVVVRHRNILSNQEMIRQAFQHDASSTVVSWLPLYHDMGLIGKVMQPIYVGASCVLMSPTSFLEKPVRWLRAISRYRGRTSGGPNFCYDLCVRKISREELDGIDLSSWDIAINGAEPVSADTLARFSEKFAPLGFRPEAFYPCYGLAEATLFVTGGTKLAGPGTLTISCDELHENRLAPIQESSDHTTTDIKELVGCGFPWIDGRILIVDPVEQRPVADNTVGEICVSGPHVMSGYWNASGPGSFAELEDGGGTFLRTGDLGVIARGALFVTGRMKDILIIRGRNYYPQDIETLSGNAHASLRIGCSAAFAVCVGGHEQPVIVHEVKASTRPEAAPDIIRAVSSAIACSFGIACHDVVLVPPQTLEKTSSGKLRRSAARAAYEAGDYISTAIASLKSQHRNSADHDTIAENIFDVNLWKVSNIVHSLLNRSDGISLDDSLDDFGLDSILAVEIADALTRSFDKRVSPKVIYELRSIRAITNWLSQPADLHVEEPNESWQIRLALCHQDRQAIYRFRYEIYVEEMSRTQRHSDHVRRQLSDPLDQFGHIFGAFDQDGHVIGTVRVNFLADGKVGNEYEEMYQLYDLSDDERGKVSITTRLMIAPAYRQSSLPRDLFEAVRNYVIDRGVTANYADCNRPVLSFATRLGYELLRSGVQHPDYGDVFVVKLRLSPGDYATPPRHSAILSAVSRSMRVGGQTG